jgi:CheY-like chemotaxis protein
VAEFFIPEHHVFIASELVQPEVRAMGSDASAGIREPVDQPLIGANVLLVEDNMLIALEAEDMLRLLGAVQVTLASTLAEADQLLANQNFHFAMLDINVGRGTSFDLASKLKTVGTPFIFASGYGEDLALERRGSEEIVIQKPYERDHLARAVEKVFQGVGVRT